MLNSLSSGLVRGVNNDFPDEIIHYLRLQFPDADIFSDHRGKLFEIELFLLEGGKLFFQFSCPYPQFSLLRLILGGELYKPLVADTE